MSLGATWKAEKHPAQALLPMRPNIGRTEGLTTVLGAKSTKRNKKRQTQLASYTKTKKSRSLTAIGADRNGQRCTRTDHLFMDQLVMDINNSRHAQ